MGLKSKTFKNAISSGFGLGIPMVLNLWATPILIISLGKEEFGLSSLFTLLTGYLLIFDFFLPFVLTQQIAAGEKVQIKKDDNPILNRSFLFFLLFGIGGNACLQIFAFPLATVIFNISDQLVDKAVICFQLTGWHILGNFLGNWARGILYGRNNFVLPNLLNILQFGVFNLAGVWMVQNGGDITDFLAFKSFSVIGVSVLLVLAVKPEFTKLVSEIKNIFSLFGNISFSFIHGLIFRVYEFVFSRPEIFIGIILTTNELTDFAVCFLIGNTFLLLITKIIEVIFPVLSKLHAEEEGEKIRSILFRGGKLIVIFISVLVLPLLVLREAFLKIWLGEAYSLMISDLFILIILAFSLHSLFFRYLSFFEMSRGNFKRLATFYALKGGSIFLFGFFLIQEFGLIGAGWSLLLATIPDLVYFFTSLRKNFAIDPVVLLIKSFSEPLAISLGLFVLLDFLFSGQVFDSWPILFLVFAGIGFGHLLLLLLLKQVDRPLLIWVKNYLFLKR